MSFFSLLSDWAVSLYLPNFLQSMTDGLRVPLVPLFARQMGASDAVVGLVVGAAGLSKALVDVPFGIATSYCGCRNTMILGMIVNIIGALVAALAVNPFQLGLGMFVCGAGIGAFFVARHVFIAAAVPRNIRGRAMSIVGGTARWATVFGPAISGVIMDVSSARVAALSLIPLSVACALCVLKSQQVRDVDCKRRGTAQAAGSATHEMGAMCGALKKYWDIIFRLGVYSLNILALRQARRLLLVLAAMNMGLSPSLVGLTLSLSFVVDASLFFLGGYIMDKFGRKYAAIPTTVNLGIGFFLLDISRGPVSLLMTSLFFGLADSTGAGILMTLTADHSPPSGGAPFMGLMRTVQDAGQVIGPVLCGVLIEKVDFSSACVFFGLVGILNGLWAFFMIPDKSASQLEEEEEEEEGTVNKGENEKNNQKEKCDVSDDGEGEEENEKKMVVAAILETSYSSTQGSSRDQILVQLKCEDERVAQNDDELTI